MRWIGIVEMNSKMRGAHCRASILTCSMLAVLFGGMSASAWSKSSATDAESPSADMRAAGVEPASSPDAAAEGAASYFPAGSQMYEYERSTEEQRHAMAQAAIQRTIAGLGAEQN